MEGENFESVPVDYPPPQVMVEAARDLEPAIEPVATAPADQAIDVGFTEVSSPIETMKDFFSAAWNNVIEPVWDQAIEPALEKLIPQGASEIAQGLFLGHGFTPYGPTAEAVPMGESSIHGSAESAPAVEPIQQEANGYQVFGPEIEQPQAFDEYNAMLAASAQRGIEMQHDHDLGMDH